MSIVRVKKRDSPYVQIDKTALNDTRLSFRARGIHAYLLSKPDNWYISIAHLEHQSEKEGREAVRTAIKELITFGYAERILVRNPQGKLGGYETVIHETPLTDVPETRLPDVGLSDFGSTDIGSSPSTNKCKRLRVEKTEKEERQDPLLNVSPDKEPLIPAQPLPSTKIPRSTATSLPETFTLTSTMHDWAQIHTPHINAKVETEQFQDHALAKNLRYSNWIAAWQFWMRTAAKWQAERAGKTPDDQPPKKRQLKLVL